MQFPAEFKYTKDHEWIKINGNDAEIGVTQYAVEQLGDIVHIDLPEVGESFESSGSFGTIESTKTVSDLYMPVDAKISAVNQDLVDSPESLQEDPHSKWIVKVSLEAGHENAELLSNSEYEKFIAEQD